MPASERLFFAVWPPVAVRKKIVSYRKALHDLRGRKVADANLHITLVFLGQVGAEQRAALTAMAASRRVASFTLTLDRRGWWPRSGVLWLAPAMIPDALLRLQAELTAGTRQCGLEVDRRDYLPHMSLSRDVKRAPETLPIPDIHWPVTDFALVRSDTRPAGVHYTVQERWQLNG